MNVFKELVRCVKNSGMFWTYVGSNLFGISWIVLFTTLFKDYSTAIMAMAVLSMLVIGYLWTAYTTALMDLIYEKVFGISMFDVLEITKGWFKSMTDITKTEEDTTDDKVEE